jgi:hypothetical protein
MRAPLEERGGSCDQSFAATADPVAVSNCRCPMANQGGPLKGMALGYSDDARYFLTSRATSSGIPR